MSAREGDQPAGATDPAAIAPDEDLFAGQDVAVCPSCTQRNLSIARFCMMCGARIKVDSGERRVVSVLFADLSGFTSYSETVDPEAVRALADEAARGLGHIVEQYGGTVDKIIGDCVMAIFGAPVAHEDDPERAVRAALEMQRYADEHADRFAGLRLTIGVHTGEAIYAPVGPSGAYTVLGDTVNTAARLQGAADKGEVLIGDPTFRAAADAIEADEMPPIVAKNKREPVLAWRATGVKGERRVKTARRTPLVGRTLELNRLLEQWERVRTEGKPQLVSVVGSPGVGKTRVIEAFLDRVARFASVHKGRCLAYGEGITYWPVIQIIRDASGIHHDDPPDVVSKKLGTLLESLGSEDLDELRTMAVAVANIADAPTTPRGTYSAEKISRAELHWGLRRIFELLSRRRPVVIVLEDLHHAEPTLLELMNFFVEAEDASMMLVGSGRPELAEAHGGFLAKNDGRRTIAIEPLTDGESEQMLVALVGESGAASMRSLLRSAGGNPLFLEEIVRMLIDSGVLDADGQPTGSLDAVPVPGNLHALIGSRLDRLSDRERAVGSQASVVGDTFWRGAVAYVGGEGDAITSVLDALEEREIVRLLPTTSVADEIEYAFQHVLIRDVAYDRVPKAVRARLHERCGDWIVQMTGDDDDYVEFVAYHFEQACRLAAEVGDSADAPPILRAATTLRRAGNKALNREGVTEADRFFARALDVLGDRFPETRLELAHARAMTIWQLGGIDEALSLLSSIVDEAAAIGRDDLHVRCLLDLANTSRARGKPAEAKELLTRAATAGSRIDDPEIRASLLMVKGSLLAGVDADIDAAGATLREAIAITDEAHLRTSSVQARMMLGTMLLNSGELSPAEEVLDAAYAIAGELGSVREQALVSTFLAFLRLQRGPRDEAGRLAQQTETWLERLSGHAYYLTQVQQILGQLALADGDLAAAEDHLRRAVDLGGRIGGRIAAEASRYLAEALARRGDAKGAHEVAEAAAAGAGDDDHTSRAYVTLARALAATAERDADSARRLFADGLLLLEELRLALDLAVSRVTCAWAFGTLGLSDEARDHLQRARTAAAAMGADAVVADADAGARALPA